MQSLRRWIPPLLAVLALFAVRPAAAQFTNGQAAVGVLGPADLVTRPAGAVTASRFNGPNGVALDAATGKLFVADRANHRVLRWASTTAMVDGSAAEAVFGQVDFTTNTSGVAANKFNNPIGVTLDAAGRLWVGDYGNNRVLRFDDAANKPTGASADGVLGQPDFTTGSSGTTIAKMSGPVGLDVDGAGRLWVSNFNNHRVLRFDDAADKADGANADGVLGQPDFTSSAGGLGANRMFNPNSVYVDGNGTLWVSDYTNRRALRFDNAAAKANGADADGVLGQPDFNTNSAGVTQSKFSTTRFVWGDSFGRLYVVEEANNRLMVFDDAATLANGSPADFVLGQPDFTTNTGPNPPNAASLATPRAIAIDEGNDRLWLADWANNRVLRYDAAFDTTWTLAITSPVGGEHWTVGSTRYITWNSSNTGDVAIDYDLGNGAGWQTLAAAVPGSAHSYAWLVPAGATRDAQVRIRTLGPQYLTSQSPAPFVVYDDSPWVFVDGQPAVGVLGPTDLITRLPGAATASRLNGPNGVALDPATGKLFVADRGNHRVLRFASTAAYVNGAAAEGVLGQADFTTATSGVTASKMNNPIGLAYDSAGRLWVGDYSNNRVLRFDDAIHKADGAPADGVLGQPDFTTSSSATTINKMNGPAGIAISTDGRLYVSNFNIHRVLRFDDAAGKANGADADGVYGQVDFTTGTSGLAQNKLANPNAMWADAGGRLWISDYANRRVLRFDDAANKPNGANADGVLGQPDFTTNTTGVAQNKFGYTRYVTTDSQGRLYVVEEANNRVMIFEGAASLANGASADHVLGQATFTTNTGPNPPNAASLATPRALLVDELLGRLWLADWANNRVLRYDLGHAASQSLALSSPNGGENWFTGSTHDVTWTSANVTAVNLDFSADSGATWQSIAAGVPASPPVYSWTLPNTPTTKGFVRITDAGNPSLTDRSAAAFTISIPVENVVLNSPNGLQQWEAGATKKVLFTASNVANVHLEVSADGGGSWSDIVASTPAAGGSYTWTIPSTLGTNYRVRVTSLSNPAATDASDQSFAIVPVKTGDEFDYLFFSDSPTGTYYDASYGTATAPSTLERVNTDKLPVSTAYSLVGNYSLKLAWTSATGGSWGGANASVGWVGHDVTVKDSLVFNVFTETATAQAALPCIYLEDLSNQKTNKIPLSTLVAGVAAGSWQRVAIPMQVFFDNVGPADMTRVKTIFFGQQDADAVAHTWYLDDFRMVGGTPQTGDSTKLIVVLGSSTSAGTGASTTDSSWVGRYRNYIHGLDPTAQVVNLAVGGYTTYNVMPTEFVPPAGRPLPSPNNNITTAMAYKPWAIVVNLPSNDVASGIPIAEQIANYDTLVARAKLAHVPMWITTSQPRNIADPVQRDQLRIMADSTISRYAPYAIDVYYGLAAPDGTILPEYGFGDGIHLNDLGHKYIFDQVVGANVWTRMLPFIDVTYPDGGDNLWIGTLDTLRWNATNTAHVTGYALALSRDGLDGPWEALASLPGGVTEFPWNVVGPVGVDTCYLRVTALGPGGALATGRSDWAFSILDAATPVALARFTADPVTGGVQLRWIYNAGSEGGSEQLFRSENVQGPWVPVAAEQKDESGTRVVTDLEAAEGRTTYYRLVITTPTNQQYVFGPVSAVALSAVTEFALSAPAPNPAAGLVRIEFALPKSAAVELTIHDVMGRTVARLANGTFEAGRHNVTWDSRSAARSGVYFVRYRVPGRDFTRRLMLVN